MKWTSTNELREKFLSFFESKGHLRLPSFSLIPRDDNSLLLINSGMAPMKKYFTGEVVPPKTRVTTCQKCIRTPDIKRVGVTARHGTFFEMLGNFSFGDYFKNEVTAWAWEFCTEVLKMPKDKLFVTIYKDDDEAFNIWTEKVGVDPTHIVRLGKEDNFWEHGSGPCGPCSEIYFDRGEEYSCHSDTCSVGCDCDRYVEFWNLVFTQFENDGNNNYSNLEHPNIDTGMGLERLACIMQGVDNLFLIDTVQKVIQHVCKVANVKYGENPKTDVSIRVITDHIKSTTMMIADGVMPSNEGRGYVLRRLLRRAARQGRLLLINEPFLYNICDTVIDESKQAYPELEEKREFIKKLVKVEEESFLKTIDQGLLLLNELIDKTQNSVLSGEDAFKLNDTFGFPIDLTKEILSEQGMSVDEIRFNELLEEQKKRARNARQNAGADAWISRESGSLDVVKTEFIGYDEFSTETKVIAILKDGKKVDFAKENEEVIIVIEKTPFYAQSGGQIFDIGTMKNNNAVVNITSVTKNEAGVFFHKGKINSGEIFENDNITASIDSKKRLATMRNHTAAHLLHAALRRVLGEHVIQAGQMVNDKEVRFDFTHFSALTDEEITEIEKLVNEQILLGLDVSVKTMKKEEAQKIGAMALFNEKYGEVVRIVNIGNFSSEFCGGTHVDNAAKLGLFKIISESSVASGVRRIEAVTGFEVINLLNDINHKLKTCAKILKVSDPKNLVSACNLLLEDNKNKDHKMAHLTSEVAKFQVESLIKNCMKIGDTKIIIKKFNDQSVDTIKSMCDKISDNEKNFVAVLITVTKEKATIVCYVGQDAIKLNLDAGKIVREIAKIAGGNGGGRPNLAMAGIKNTNDLDKALNSTETVIKAFLKV